MKPFYYAAPSGNVGDDLNSWIWPRLVPELLDENLDHLLLGIGSILNHRIPPARRYTVIGAGIGYGSLPDLNVGEWDFVCLRGPISKAALAPKGDPVLIDGGYLLRLCYAPVFQQGGHSAFVPHVDSAISGLWEDACSLAGVPMIDPRWPIKRFTDAVCNAKLVICEAMHGAIIADMFGIPWIAVRSQAAIDSRKWNDWGNALNTAIRFHELPSLWRGDAGAGVRRRAINTFKRVADAIGVHPATWTPVAPARSRRNTVLEAANRLNSLSLRADLGQLTPRALLATRLDALQEAVEQVRVSARR